VFSEYIEEVFVGLRNWVTVSPYDREHLYDLLLDSGCLDWLVDRRIEEREKEHEASLTRSQRFRRGVFLHNQYATAMKPEYRGRRGYL